MITCKAIMGFILLAIIVFPTAYISWTAPLPETGTSTSNLGLYKHMDNSQDKTITYRAPLVTFNNPFDMGFVVTIIIEVFALLSYLVMKRIEPALNAWVADEMMRLHEGQDDYDETNP